jgi:hypothetical protein
MQEGNKKEKWGKPILCVIARGKHEERVLDGCKSMCAFSNLTPDAGASCNQNESCSAYSS